MQEESIFQFVCFETAIDTEDFSSQWDTMAKKFLVKGVDSITLQEQAVTKNKFKFVSKNKWAQDSFQFLFTEGRLSEKFPSGQVKVIQAGGYSPLQIQSSKKAGKKDIKIIAFISDEQTDISVYQQLQTYRYLNIYQAFYQNSLYAYVLEYFVDEEHAASIIEALKQHSIKIDVGMYKESIVLA